MERSEQFDQITAAFFKIKTQVAVLPLVKDAAGDKSKYLRLGTLLAAIEPIMLANDCVIIQGNSNDAIQDGVISGIRVETTLLHLSGQWMRNSVLIPVAGAKKAKADGGGFNPPDQQSGGVSITYGRRYGLFAFFSLSPDEDSDGAVRNSARRARATAVAVDIASKTTDRLTALREKLNADKVVCECGAKQGEAHKPGCKNAAAQKQKTTG